MDGKYILVNDVGTTGTRAVLFDRETEIVSEVYREIPQIFPQPGWCEQDPIDLFQASLEVTREALREAGVEAGSVAGMGIATQRATSIIWDADTGEPVYNAITWQDTRMSDACERINCSAFFKLLHLLGGVYQKVAVASAALRRNPLGKMLITAAHFTVTPAQTSAHARWVLDNVPGAQERAAAGKLLLGTVDSWMVWNYTRGSVHATDYSNVSATGMYDPFAMKWSPLLLKPFKLPGDLAFPHIRETAGDFGSTDFFGDPIPIKCVVADQQAALFGEACFERGSVKCTNGTGTFVDINTGDAAMASINRLTPLIAWRMRGETAYMMEGIISSAGSSIQWLRDNLQIIERASDSEALARACEDSGGVYVVPAFTGLTAPYWDPYARGTVIGLTRATGKEQVVRATLESIAYQCKDVIEAMQKDTGIEVAKIKADGGASANDFLLQFMADILDVEVERPQVLEATALGAAFFAGIAAGMWEYPDDIVRIRRVERTFTPAMGEDEREALYAGWKKAVIRASRWA